MELNKKLWINEDKQLFISHLENYQRKEKEAWARKILNTKLDLLVLPTKVVHDIANDIFKGNYRSFLDLQIFSSYESIALYGMILSKIQDFKEMSHYLEIYLNVMENWAHCDLLSLPISSKNKNDFLLLSEKYLTDPRTFVRRLSLMILFQMIQDETVLSIVFDRLLRLKNEDEYYVIMMAGWLLSECIILYKNKTLEFINNTTDLNKKILNKGIQKCRESRRLSQEEKDSLLKYKRK